MPLRERFSSLLLDVNRIGLFADAIVGVTHSAVWAAACSYIAHNTPPELRVSAQGVLTFVHNGAGRACGTIIGGIFSTAYGPYQKILKESPKDLFF